MRWRVFLHAASVLAVLWASCAWAGIYTAPLDGLKGVYSNGDLAPIGKTISVDFGRQFERIDSVRIEIKGTIAPGLWSIRSVIEPFGETKSEILEPLNFFIRLPGDHLRGGDASVQHDGAFEIQVPFTRYYTPDWSFLKGGQAELECQLGSPFFLAIYAAEQIVPGIAGIADARLIIEGQVVPEPAGVLGMALGGLMLLSRQDCRR